MKPKKGYWVAIPASTTTSVEGRPMNCYTDHFAVQGWTMIGSVMGSVDFANPQDNPDGKVLSPLFGWDGTSGAYASSNALNEKKGYWAAVLGACDLTVGWAGGGIPKILAEEDQEGFFTTYGITPPLPPDIDFETGRKGENPKDYRLFQNFPNPFNPVTKIQFQLPEEGRVNLSVYDILGRKERTLVDEIKPAGCFEAFWDGKDNDGTAAECGVYVARIQTNRFVSCKKIILLR
jgi:hypothetical protein